MRSYSPVGTSTVTLVPTMAFLGALTNSPRCMASLPRRFTESLTRVSARPERVTVRASSNTRPLTSPQAYGTATDTRASLPNMSNVVPTPKNAALIVASTSVSGMLGS